MPVLVLKAIARWFACPVSLDPHKECTVSVLGGFGQTGCELV